MLAPRTRAPLSLFGLLVAFPACSLIGELEMGSKPDEAATTSGATSGESGGAGGEPCGSGGGNPCDDGASCTVDTCDETLGACANIPDGTLCAPGEACNPSVFVGSGCGPSTTHLALSCPAPSIAGATVTCALDLTTTGNVGLPGEAAHIACAARPAPLTLFSDDFDDGELNPPWIASSGTPKTDGTLATNAAFADQADWDATVSIPVGGLSVVCVDFDVAQSGAGTQERVRWELGFDGEAAALVFDLDFESWTTAGSLFLYNKNACAAVPPGATTASWTLRMSANNKKIWVDNVSMTGLSAPFVDLTTDPFSDTNGWTLAGGSPPYLTSFSQSTALFAQQQSFTATSAPIDASACDVVGVDFDFGFLGDPDAGETILLEGSTGSAFTTVEKLDLNGATWDKKDQLFPWLGLRTNSPLGTAGASALLYRFTLSSDDSGDAAAVDNFAVQCADLPDPVITPIADLEGGHYAMTLTTSAPEAVLVTCSWSTQATGAIASSQTVVFTSP